MTTNHRNDKAAHGHCGVPGRPKIKLLHGLKYINERMSERERERERERKRERERGGCTLVRDRTLAHSVTLDPKLFLLFLVF